MKRKTNTHKVAGAFLVLLISAPHVANAMESRDSLGGLNSKNEKLQELPVGGYKLKEEKDLSEQFRNHDYYIKELQKLEESTRRIHEKVDQILKEFRRNMAEYYQRTRKIRAITDTKSDIKTSEYIEEELKNDKLKNYDYSNFKIPCRQTVEGLKSRYIDYPPLNTVGTPKGAYTINGKTFRMQNVSGGGKRCFFNSVGLTPPAAIEQLKKEHNDPVVRYMIANEIVQNGPCPSRFSNRVKKVIGYEAYMEALWADYSTSLETDAIIENISKNLRAKALSLAAFDTYVNDNIDGAKIVIDHFDLDGTRVHLGDIRNGYTSIDAIAYTNNFGIRIYQLDQSGFLRLTHQFIPARTKEIAYLYDDGINHFQVFIPQD